MVAKVLSADELGMPIVRALGIPETHGVISVVLTIRGGEVPTLLVETHLRNVGGMYVRSETDPAKFETVLQRYELRLKETT